MKLWRYLQGNRKGKEAHRIEKEAMSDPFLADAIEGYEKIPGNHQREVAKLQKEISRCQKQITNKSLGRKSPHLKAWSIAACIFVVVGTGAWFLLDNSPIATAPQENNAMKPTVVTDDESAGIMAAGETIKEEQPSPAQPQKLKADIMMRTATADVSTDTTRAVITPAHTSTPQPVAGMKAYMDYINRNLRRPTDEECRNAKGPVIVVFKIGQSGRPYNINVTQGLCSSTNKEAIRLIINGPNWKKGTASDEATLTINF